MENVISRSQLGALISSGIAKFDYEALLAEHYKKWIQAGDTVVDVGAHEGRHLSEMKISVGNHGKIIAFEPIPDKYLLLSDNFDFPNVSLINSALSDRSGMAEFTHAKGCPGESGLKERIFNLPEIACPTKIRVKLERLDHYIDELNNLSFIKIDIEGGEIDCLWGALSIIKKYRPVISVEYGFSSYSVYGHTKWALFEFCEKNEYVLYDIFLNRMSTIELWNASVDTIYWDYLMVSKEKEPLFIERVINS